MKWMRERDALIAQTLAFVQSVTGRRDAGEPRLSVVPTPALSPPADHPSPAVPAITEAPPKLDSGDRDASLDKSSLDKTSLNETIPDQAAEPAAPSNAPRPLVPSDFQRELTARIASFRAHQERFNREREEYFSATLARLRAAIKYGAPPGPRG